MGKSIGRRFFMLLLLGTFAGGILASASRVDAGTYPARNWRELNQIKRKLMAAQFLSHATFGPTMEQINALADQIQRRGRRRAFSEWIDRQFEQPATLHKSLARQMVLDDGFELNQDRIGQARYRHHAWWHNAITAEDQLRQRMAWALAQIFVINEFGPNFNLNRDDASGNPAWLGVSDYYDMLVDNAFGTYRETLQDVTYHPIMGRFLSHWRNPKGDPRTGRFPDENYAREVQQLFSIGLYKMRLNGQFVADRDGNLIPTYDNEDIKSFARVFTGLAYPGNDFWRAPLNYNQPMQMYEAYHDTDEKTLLNGVVLPAGQTGDKDISDALDSLADHPNVAPFISRQLIMRFVKSNPSKGYVRRVARRFNNDGRGQRGNWQAVLKAILTDREALNGQLYIRQRRPLALVVKTRGTETSRLLEPAYRYASFVRAFHGTSDYATGRIMLPQLDYHLAQESYRAPHVFNFYLPNHVPQELFTYVPSRRIPNGSLVAPEFEILTAVSTNRLANRFRADVRDAIAQFTLINNEVTGTIRANINFDFSPEEALAGDPAALMRHLNMLLCNGSMSDRAIEIISKIIAEETADPATRARGAILSTLTSPAAAISQ